MSIIAVIILFLVLVLTGVPIAFCMFALSFLYFSLGPTPYLVAVIPQKLYEGIDVYLLTAIPFFLLAGEIMNRSGMSDRLMRFCDLVVGRFYGGLAYVNVMVSVFFAGLTGIAIGDIAALGKIEVRTMEQAGYSRAFAAAVTISSSLIGPIIPPSTIIILYCAVMNVSVGGMFLAALLPGLLMAVGDMIVIWVQARLRNYPKHEEPATTKDIVKGASDASLAIVMPVLLIGGIVGGIATPTEAAALSVVYALVIAVFFYRDLKLKEIWSILGNCAYESARLLLMIGAALTITWIFALERLPQQFASLFEIANAGPFVQILLINLLLLFLGMFLDIGLIVILFGPIVAPVAYAIGLDPLQLGIMLIVNVTVGLATPPVGNALFAMSGVVSVDMRKLVAELLPFLAIKFILLLMISMIPAISLTIPRYFGF